MPLFEIHPKFEPGGMDPRPLLALNAPNEYSANIYDYDEIQRKVERGNTNEAINSASKYGPAARIDIAYRLLDYDLSNQDMNEKANFVNTIVDISINSIDAIDENQSYLFEDCFNIIKENRNIVNNVSRNNYEKWIRFAHKIGNDSLDMLLDPSSPFMREDKTNFLRKISEIALEFDSDFIDRVLEIEVNEVENGNEVNSAQRMKKIFQEENIKDAENAPEYLLQLLDNWSFSDNPDGPPESLLNEDVIELFGQKEYREKAMQVFDKVGSQGDPGRDYVDILMENNWPRRRERDS